MCRGPFPEHADILTSVCHCTAPATSSKRGQPGLAKSLLYSSLHCTALLHRCAAAHHLAAIALHFTASRAATAATRPSSALLHRLSVRPVSALSARLAERRCQLERLRPSSAVFYQSGSLRESAFLIASATRSSFHAARARAKRPFRAARARAWRPHCYDSVASLRTASYLRSTLPAAAILPCAYNHLPSGTVVIFNF